MARPSGAPGLKRQRAADRPAARGCVAGLRCREHGRAHTDVSFPQWSKACAAGNTEPLPPDGVLPGGLLPHRLSVFMQKGQAALRCRGGQHKGPFPGKRPFMLRECTVRALPKARRAGVFPAGSRRVAAPPEGAVLSSRILRQAGCCAGRGNGQGGVRPRRARSSRRRPCGQAVPGRRRLRLRRRPGLSGCRTE